MKTKTKTETQSKSKSTIVLIILLLLVLLTMVGYNTFAKYTSSVTGSDEVTAAKWSFKVDGKEIALTPDSDPATIGINLFSTIKDSDISEDETDTSGKLAPGTSGSFVLKVQNTSDVTAKYAIDLEVVGAEKLPLEYSIDGGAWTSSLNSIAASDSTVLAANSAEKKINIAWRWAFSDATDDKKDEKDTAIGIAIREGTINKVSVNATVTAVQVD